MISKTNPEGVTTLRVTFEEWTELFRLAAERLARFPYPANEVIFSCSPHGIWPTTRRGFISPHERTLIDGKSRLLDTIASLMLSEPVAVGGRFTVTSEGAFRTRNLMPVCLFELGA